MDGRIFQHNWSEMRGQISEWWDDLTDEDLDGNQEQLIAALQERYGYTRNLAFVEVKIRMASYQLEGEEREKHTEKDGRSLEYPRYGTDGRVETIMSKTSADLERKLVFKTLLTNENSFEGLV